MLTHLSLRNNRNINEMDTWIGMKLKRKLLRTVWPRQCERDIMRALEENENDRVKLWKKMGKQEKLKKVK